MQCRCKLGGCILPASLRANRGASLAARALVIPSSRFRSVLAEQIEACPTRQAYHGVDLASLSAVARGDVVARVVRRLQCGEGAKPLTADPIPGVCQNGAVRCQRRAEYDWLCQGRRIECKSSILRWDVSAQAWSVYFSGVKFSKRGGQEMRLFDDLLIVLITPRHLLVYMHDWAHGVSNAGVKTVSTGHAIQLRGPKYESSWEKALDSIVAKLGASKCRLISVMPLNHKDVLAELNATAMSQTSSLISRAYNAVPFATLNSFARAVQFRKLAYTMDTLLHPGSHFEEAVVDTRINGSRRSPQQATYSWSRNGQRVACKHSQLSWDTSHEWWKCHFAHVRSFRFTLVYAAVLRSPLLPSAEGGGRLAEGRGSKRTKLRVVNSLVPDISKTPHVKVADSQRRLAAGFDDLILVMYTPRGLYIYRHDLEFGITSSGNQTSTRGHCIKMNGGKGRQCWEEALDAILHKLDRSSRCDRIAMVKW